MALSYDARNITWRCDLCRQVEADEASMVQHIVASHRAGTAFPVVTERGYQLLKALVPEHSEFFRLRNDLQDAARLGARPFFVDEEGNQIFQESEVDPLKALDTVDGNAIAGSSRQDTEEAGLSKVERGIVETVRSRRLRVLPLQNGLIAADMQKNGIYNERTGEAYAEETISRYRRKLRNKGYDV